MLLSFIIPSYNSEKFIINTLEFICKEIRSVDKRVIEIIIINDGSTDRTEEILQKYIKDNPDLIIKTFYKENGGLSDARNFGIGKAEGEYLWFFDADDLIEPNVLAGIIDRLITDKLDLLSLGIRDCFKDYKLISNMDKKPVNTVVSGLSYIKDYNVEHSAWSYVIRKSILLDNNIFFIKGVLSEDYDFNWRIYEKCSRVSHLGEVAYNYIIRDGSLSRRKDDKYYKFHHESMIRIFEHTNTYFTELGNQAYYDVVKLYYSRLKAIALIVLLKSTFPIKDRLSYFEKMKENGVCDLVISNKLNYKQKIIALLVKMKLYPLVFKLIG